MGIHFVFWYFRFIEVLRVSQTLTLSLFLSVCWTTFSGPERNMLTTGVRWMGRISRVVLCWQPRILEHSLSSTSCFSLVFFFFFFVFPAGWPQEKTLFKVEQSGGNNLKQTETFIIKLSKKLKMGLKRHSHSVAKNATLSSNQIIALGVTHTQKRSHTFPVTHTVTKKVLRVEH